LHLLYFVGKLSAGRRDIIAPAGPDQDSIACFAENFLKGINPVTAGLRKGDLRGLIAGQEIYFAGEIT
jgi:hypothetical protein